MRKSLLVFLLGLFASTRSDAGLEPPEGGPWSYVAYDVSIDREGHARVTERWTLHDAEPGARVRRLQCIGIRGSYPLRMRLERVTARLPNESPLPSSVRTRATGAECVIDLPELPDDGRFVVSYGMRGYASPARDGSGWAAGHRIARAPWPPVRGAEMVVRFPEPITEDEARAVEWPAGFQASDWSYADGVLRVRLLAEGVERDDSEPFQFVLRVSSTSLTSLAGSAYFLEVARQAGWTGAAGLALLLMAWPLRSLSTKRLLTAARLYACLTIGLVASAVASEAWFLWRDTRLGVPFTIEAGVSLAHVLVDAALAIAAALVVARLPDRRPTYYLAPLPLVGLTTWTAFEALVLQDLTRLGAPLSSLALLVLWRSPKIARWYGVGILRLLAAMAEKGRVAFTEVERLLGLPHERAFALLRRVASAPYVIDRDEGFVYDAAALALREDYAVCARCGDGTHVQAQSIAACRSCGWTRTATDGGGEAKARNKRARRAREVEPDGVLHVRAAFVLATLPLVAMVLHIQAAVIAHAGTPGVSIRPYLFVWAVSTAVLSTMALGFLWTQWRMGRGRAQGAFRFAARLLPGVTAKAPATELFFDPERERRLVEQLDGLGEIPLTELGKKLGGSDEEATELVFSMMQEGRLDWVHDRTRRRVVARRLFVGAQAADGCAACGGVLGVRAGRAACLYCGVTPAGERVG